MLPDDVVFTCQQSGACCRNDWLIGVEDSARARLEARAAAIAVHFDVDVMDSAEIPLADWPHYDALEFGEAMHCLRVFVSSPKLAALVVTEINPDHDPDGLLIRRFVDGFADALQSMAAEAARQQQRQSEQHQRRTDG